jgi:hypothetical protein
MDARGRPLVEPEGSGGASDGPRAMMTMSTLYAILSPHGPATAGSLYKDALARDDEQCRQMTTVRSPGAAGAGARVRPSAEIDENTYSICMGPPK